MSTLDKTNPVLLACRQQTLSSLRDSLVIAQSCFETCVDGGYFEEEDDHLRAITWLKTQIRKYERMVAELGGDPNQAPPVPANWPQCWTKVAA